MAHRGPVRLAHIVTAPQSLRFMRGQVAFMRERGFELHAIASPGDELTRFGASEHVSVHAVEMPRRISPLQDLLSVWHLTRLLRRLRPAIVHSHTPKGGLLGTLAAWAARVPVRIYHIRGLPLTTAVGARRLLLRWTETVACHFAHEVLCVSHSIRDVAVAERLCPPHKIRVLGGGSGNGVDADGVFNPARYDPSHRRTVREGLAIPEDALVVGFVGRLVRDKGVVELTEAWRRVRDLHPTAVLLVIGPMEPQDPVPATTLEALRTDPRVRLTGPADAGPLFAAMDLLVLPTYREGFPNVLLEAAAMQLPVVATDVPGCVDAVVATSGVLVPAKDAVALADAIAEYLGNPSLREAHGRAGRARVLREFRQPDIWAALYREYERLLTQRGMAAPSGELGRTTPLSTAGAD